MITVSGQLSLNYELAQAFVNGTSDEELEKFLLLIFNEKSNEYFDKSFISKLKETWSD